MSVWLERFGDLPYTPSNARLMGNTLTAQATLDKWNLGGGREAAAEKEARGPVLPRLEGCLQEARALSARYDILSDDGPWLRMSALLQLMASIIEELKA